MFGRTEEEPITDRLSPTKFIVSVFINCQLYWPSAIAIQEGGSSWCEPRALNGIVGTI